MPFICSEKHVQEKDFLSLVCFCNYYWILLKTFRTCGESFSAGLSNFVFASRGHFFSENGFFCKPGSTSLFDFFVRKFWQAHEHFNFWCPMEDSGENNIFEKLAYVKFLPHLSRAVLGVWPETLGQVFEATFYWTSELFLGNGFFWKTVNFGNFCGGRDKYLRSLGKKLLKGLSKLHSSFRKDFFEGKHTFWEKNT